MKRAARAGEGASRPTRRRRRLVRGLLALALVGLAAGCQGCSPVYVIKAGLAQAEILRNREPISEVVGNPATDQATRDKLAFALEARRFAAEELGIDVGDAYTQYTELESDTLALVLSAARQDRLVPKTWWFPIVGHVPYKGFFDEADARGEQEELEEEGYDTWLRPTAAFSTLGWFNDPILSSMLRSDEIEVVETLLHELSHRYLFAPGRVRFNESFATWAGRVGAARFFCTREGGGPDTLKCARARARWRDYQRFGVFVDDLVEELTDLYGDTTLSQARMMERREEIFDAALERFDDEVQPTFESIGFAGFRRAPLNNATLLARMRYYHRLPDFDALLEREGSLGAAMAYLRENLDAVDDPFELLPEGGRAPSPKGASAVAGPADGAEPPLSP